jgi:hypothetical protein
MNIYLYIKKPNLNQQHSAGHQSWQLNVTTINNSASYLSYNKYIFVICHTCRHFDSLATTSADPIGMEILMCSCHYCICLFCNYQLGL